MSTVSALNRQNRVYTATVQTPAADGTSTILYASIGNFPNVATIHSVKVTLSTGTLTNPTVSILNNGAAHKVAPTVLFATTNARVATTTVLPSTAAISYVNGAAGVGATLTRGENGALGAIDGVTLSVGDRILVKNQATQSQNGIYTVTVAGSGAAAYVLTCATDADQTTTEIRYGEATTITAGASNINKKFFMNNSAAITVGTTAITFVEYTALVDSFVEGSGAGTVAGQDATATFTAPGLNWQDSFHANCLNLAVSMAGAIPSGGKFTLDIEYTPLQEFAIIGTDATGLKADNTWRVLRQPSSGNAIDITDEIKQNFNPYGLGADNNSLSVVALSVSADELYIGSEKIFTKILVHPHASSYIGAGIGLTAEYWNGSSWVALAQVLDNTSDLQATASTLSYPGVISFAAPSDWTKQKIATDPMTVYENGILAGTEYPPGMMVHPSRYFLRFSIASLVAPLRLVKLLPLV